MTTNTCKNIIVISKWFSFRKPSKFGMLTSMYSMKSWFHKKYINFKKSELKIKSSDFFIYIILP